MGGVSNSNLFSSRTNVNFNCVKKIGFKLDDRLSNHE